MTMLKKMIAASAAMVLATSVCHSQVKELRVMEAGGASGDSIELAYIKPFTERTGIKVIRENPTSLGKLQAMVQSNNVTSALVELGSFNVAMARAQGLLEPLDWAAINPGPMYPEAKLKDAFGYQYSSTIIASEKGAKKMRSWADFWNVKDFPGKRALPDYPSFALPIALLADGVKAENLYPLDLDRAFASLRKIKDSVNIWWTSGAQPTQLLEDKEVRYSAAWSGRVVGNPKIDATYDNGMLSLSYFVVPKGADPAAKAAAMKLLHEMSQLKNQAVAAGAFPATGPSPGIEQLLPVQKLADLPTTEANKKIQALNDPQNDPTMTPEKAKLIEKRWQEFKLGM